ncbi:hypothetical protein PF005_g6172 [Phytophthora fragariae]|uniref:Fibronectin type III-like domain-containing protein n=1 Tax=Phytophthora fragariae TaxID=53985 RepID=A0A6A4A2T9_9STRA|nr:hypothetical protein PF011_g10600 [Phytophthora fragariae]KAE9110122.1 hypothetical protein PF010_g11278 [Phytophthora fragariae]KAE9124837.1 hypothetical protein PF007_g6568 [Phytophthora fragariae]KAE9223762.1 hypothetical protein PF005_g6172 [Phytophthora fragariae]KAE9229309.1 hypothetical protein PF004_g10812 [Phytophthora fragariae]
MEVPEVYIDLPADDVATYPDAKFAAIALVGFANVELEADASTTVNIGIREKYLSFYNNVEDAMFSGHVQI